MQNAPELKIKKSNVIVTPIIEKELNNNKTKSLNFWRNEGESCHKQKMAAANRCVREASKVIFRSKNLT